VSIKPLNRTCKRTPNQRANRYTLFSSLLRYVIGTKNMLSEPIRLDNMKNSRGDLITFDEDVTALAPLKPHGGPVLRTHSIVQGQEL
jgi:hypothetical protein